MEKIKNWDSIIFVVALAYFILRLCFLAVNISTQIPPDELTHIQLSLLYSLQSGWTIPDSAQTYHMGPVSRFPWLYHWLLGRCHDINLFQISPIIFFRFINIALSVITVIFSYKFFRLLTTDKWIPILGVIVLTNIPMYSFLSAFVSYDNLANLFAIISFYYFFLYLKNYQAKHLGIAAVCSLLGTLTKHSSLPLLLIFAVILLMDFWYRRQGFSFPNRFSLSPWTPAKVTATVLILILVGLNLNLYAVNFLRYKRALPSCTQVLTHEQCSQGKNFRIYDQLGEQAKKIPKSEFLKPLDYFSQWNMLLEGSILGIMGHRLMYKTPMEILPYNILILLSFLFMLYRFKDQKRLINYCAISVVLYAFILFYFVNYKSYLKTAYPPAGLQGRYLFPVIYPLVFLFSYFLLNNFQKILRVVLFLGVTVVLLWGDLPYFLKHADSSWYIQP